MIIWCCANYSPPEDFGFAENQILCGIVSPYLGMLGKCFSNFFGKYGHQSLDEYGANISVALLQGKVFCMLHNTVGCIDQTTMNLCAIQCKQNVVNFLAEKVPEPCLTIYNNFLDFGQD